MKQIVILKLVIILLLFSIPGEADAQSQIVSETRQIEAMVKGVVIDRTCAVIPNVKLTFRNRKRSQVVMSDENGQFKLELRGGNYLITIQSYNTSDAKWSDLSVSRSRDGATYFLVNTGFESTCPCFDFPTAEDFLIPESPIILIKNIEQRKLLSKP